jgi:hypothetical protein
MTNGVQDPNQGQPQQPIQSQQPVQPQQPIQPQPTQPQETGFNQPFQNPDLPVVQSGELPDLEQYEGRRAKLEGWDIIEVNSYYNPDTGDRMSTPITVQRLKVFSEKLGEGKKSDGTPFDIRATALFPLKKDASGNLGISSHSNSNIQKFFRKLKINSLPEMKDKYVTVTVSESGWLNIIY